MPSSEVWAACKLPGGIICRVFEPAERDEGTPAGVKRVKYFKPRRTADDTGDQQVTIPGYASTWQRQAAGQEFYRITGPHPGDFMREYMKQNHSSDIVRRGLLLIADTRAELEAKIKDHENIVTGSGMGPPLASSTDDRGRALHHDTRIKTIGGPQAVTTASEQREGNLNG
jgi:hypothetical protein